MYVGLSNELFHTDFKYSHFGRKQSYTSILALK